MVDASTEETIPLDHPDAFHSVCLSMLCRTLLQSVRRARGVFTFEGSRVPHVNDKTRPFDVDAMVEAVREGEGLKVHKKGHLTSQVLKSDLQLSSSGRRRRNRLRLGPREKYMFKKMKQMYKEQMPRTNDPGSDLRPLYEMTRPWLGFSPLKDRPEKVSAQPKPEKYNKKEKEAVLQIRRTIEESQYTMREHNAETTNTSDPVPGGRGIVREATLDFYRSAESIEQNSDEKVLRQRAELTERIATNLHRAELESKHEFLKDTDPSSSDEHNEKLNKALSRDPTFQQDALKFEADSPDLQNVDQWIHSLRSFAAQHEDVLQSMDTQNERLVVTTPPDADFAGGLERAFKQNMIEGGVNVEAIERQARKEIERELSRNKRKHQPPEER